MTCVAIEPAAAVPETGGPAGAEGKVLVQGRLCKACGLCILTCPRGALRKGKSINELGYAATEVAHTRCSGCGTCFYMCPEPGVISVVRPDRDDS